MEEDKKLEEMESVIDKMNAKMQELETSKLQGQIENRNLAFELQHIKDRLEEFINNDKFKEDMNQRFINQGDFMN